MSYRVRFTTHTGATGYWDGTFATHTGASMSAQTRADVTGYTYTVEEVPDAPATLPPRRVWEEQRIRALAQAIVRRMGHEAPKVATVFDLGHIHDWAAEIVELCERCGGQQAKPKDAEAIRRLEADNQELRDRLAVAQRQRDEAAAVAKEKTP